MLKIPRIAVFKVHPEEEESVIELFKKHDYSLRQVENISQVHELTIEEGDSFDAIIVPLQLADNTSGITTCIQLKSDQTLSTIPVLALSSSKDLAVIQAFYGAGADTVFCPPFNPDMLYMQIGSLARLKRTFDEKLNAGYHETGLYHPVVKSFHSFREGLLLFDVNFNVIFLNRAAKSLLGIRETNQKADTASAGEQFKSVIKEHDSRIRLQPPEARKEAQLTTFEVNTIRINKQQFRGLCGITSLYRDDNELVGFSLALTDLSEIHHLSNTLLQAQRTRSLCMVATAACLKFLQKDQSFGISPLQYMTNFLSESPRSCPLYATVTSLMEVIDLLINTEMNIRVKVEKDLYLAVQAPDLFQLLGHMLLHAVEHAGMKGEASFHSTDNIPGQGVTLTISSESRKVTPISARDQISKLIHGDFTGVSSIQDVTDKLNLGLHAAQRIAEKYRSTIEYQHPSSTLMKIRVKLPVGRPPQ